MATNGVARLVMIVAAMVAPATAIAQQRSFITPGLTLQPRASATKPFTFRVQPRPAAAKQLESTKTVVCGMKIIRADPTIDLQILKSPADTKTTFTMETVRPTACAAP
jgi:hypothetical protein